MLDPDIVLSAVVSALRDIPDLVVEMGGDSSRIYGHYYAHGEENSLARAIFSMTSPSILIAYADLLGGNFDGGTIWKHRLEAYIRPKNRASGQVGGTGGSRAATAPHLWYVMMNSVTTAQSLCIRKFSLLSGRLYLMDTPTLSRRQDENLADVFVGSMVFPEAGDD